MSIKVINIDEKLSTFSEHWKPKIVGELNEQLVKIAKLKGEFVMHQHEHEDEMFLVLEGTLLMQMEKETKEIKAGEFIIIPKGTPHKPIATEEVKIMLFEPKTTLNTGDLRNDFTVTELENI